MVATKQHLRRLESALDAAGIDEKRFIEVAIATLAAARPPHVLDPESQFTSDEREALAAGGVDLSPRTVDDPDPIADTTARFVALLADSADVAEVAERLQVTRARVRQRAIERSLFAIREGDEWRFPRRQFEGKAPIRALSSVVSALSPDLHPVAAWRFLTEPSPDLEIGSERVSPFTWLGTGGAPDPVVVIAREL